MDSIRKIIKYILIVFILIAGAYCAFFSFKILDEQQLGIVQEISSSRVVRVFSKKYNFVPEGILPMVYSVYHIAGNRTINDQISIDLPALAELANPRYKIIIPVSLSFIVDSSDSAALSFILDNTDKIDEEILKITTSIFIKETDNYLQTSYNKTQLLNNIDKIEQNVADKLRSAMKKIGCNLLSVTVPGAITMPERVEYYRGLKHLDILHSIEQQNESKLKIMKSAIEREDISNKQYYKNLTEISVLLKENPDLIKYIYIDKLADRIKVVPSIKEIESLSSNSNNSVAPSQGKGEIDNLR